MTVIVAQAHITRMSHILRLAAQQEKGQATTPWLQTEAARQLPQYSLIKIT